MATDSGAGAGRDGSRGGVFEASPDAILICDVDGGTVVDANDAAATLFGRPRDALRGERLAALWPDDAARDAGSVLEAALAEGSGDAEWELAREDGNRWVDLTVEPVDETGERAYVFLRDLTERRQLELDLRHEQGLTERVLDTTPTGIVVHDADGEITMANPRAESILGLERSDLDGRGYDDPAFDLRTVEDEPLAAREFPFARIAETGEAITGEQVVVRTPEADRILTVSGAPLWDDAGAFDGAVMSIQDVTSDFEQETRIREQKEHLETIVGHLPVVLFVLDPEGRFTFSRGRGLEGLGLEPGDLEGMSVFEAYADNPDIVDTCERALEGESIQCIQEAGGRVFDTQYRPVVEDGEVQQVIGVSLDVTDRVEHERQLETLTETMPTGAFMASADGEIEYMNDTAAELVGADGDDAVGERMADVLGSEQLEPFQRHHRDAIEREERIEREHSFRTPAGERTIWAAVTPIESASGDPYGVVGVARDVTERVERERRLEENDAILGQLTDTTEDVFWLFDGDFEELRFVNDAYEDVWGRSTAALREDPMDFMAGVHPDDREQVLDVMERVRQGESTEVEYRVNPGEEFGRWVSVSAEPVFEDGEVVRVAGIARDVTERKERERELERRERQFEAVFNDPQLLVGVLDTDGRIQQVNDTALEYAATEREAVEGVPFAETPWWNHDPDLQADLRAWLDSAADGEYVDYEAVHPLPGGGEMTAEGTIRPVTDADGTVQSLIASARDVTERVERERQLAESNERLEKFAYVASHDLQEPLRTVSNYVELLADEYADDLDEEGQRFVDVAVTGSQRMQSMINGLLDYSRVTTRGDEFERVDADAVVGDAMNDLELMVEEHDGTVEWGDLPTVEADRDQLRRLFQNLVTNAFEHGGDGPVSVAISATETADAYRFAVEDDGVGIAENRQEKVFRIFKSGTQYQTSSQAKGIGLAVCDNIVQRHGGEIWVESTPGEGATFYFTIPKAD